MERTWCKPLPAADLLIQGGRVVDPETGVDAVKDVLIKKGKVSETGKGLVAPEGTPETDFARPKSTSFAVTCPSPLLRSMMFAGLMSRWTSPARCNACKARLI